MEISPVLQARLLLYSFIFGGGLGALCDVTYILCHSLVKKRVPRFTLRLLLDVLLCFIAGGGFILLCYYFNDGELRGFCALGILGGFLVWRVTLSRVLRLLLKKILSALFSIIRFISTPFIKIFKLLVNIFKKTVYSIFKAIAKRSNIVYNIYVKKSVLARARRGFLKK